MNDDYIDDSVDRRIESHFPDVQEGDTVAVTYKYNYSGDQTTRTGEVIQRGDHMFRFDHGDGEKTTKVVIRASPGGDHETVRVTSNAPTDSKYGDWRHLADLNMKNGLDDVDVELVDGGD